jgi:four helix bundle protein
MNGYRDLIAWQKAMSLAEAIYQATAGFPREEQFGVVSQLRRAGASIPSNIAEGYGRSSKADFARFLRIALGSTREVEMQIILAGRLQFSDRDSLKQLLHQAEEVGKILNGLLRS